MSVLFQIKLPEWAYESGKIRIFAGYELVAVLTKTSNGWETLIKTGRCKMKLGIPCEICYVCEECDALEDSRCKASYGIPFRCLSSIANGIEECTEKFEEG